MSPEPLQAASPQEHILLALRKGAPECGAKAPASPLSLRLLPLSGREASWPPRGCGGKGSSEKMAAGDAQPLSMSVVRAPSLPGPT